MAGRTGPLRDEHVHLDADFRRAAGPGLQAVVEAWPTLLAAVRVGIAAMVRAVAADAVDRD